MPVANAKVGAGFGGLARYLLSGSDGQATDRVAWTAMRNLRADGPEGAALEMRWTADVNRRVQKPVYHISLNWPTEDRPSPIQMETAVDRLLQDLGLHEHQALLVAHRDTEHPHVHIMVNRVHPSTFKTWDNKNDWRRIRASLHRLEREMGWRVVAGSTRNLAEAPPAEVARLREAALEPMRNAHNWGELETLLLAQGLSIQARGRGMVITDGEYFVKASAIDRSVSRPRLEERFQMPYTEWRRQVRRVHKLTQDHRRVAHRAARRVSPRGVSATVNRARHRAGQFRSALEGTGDLKLIEHKLAAFAIRFGSATLRRVSPAAAAILWAARAAKRTLDRERSR